MKPLKIIAKLLIILLVFSLISCDENIFTDYADDSSDEAQLEAALIYLDDGEYSKAKAILETLDQSDEEVKRALASCYAGLAGLDIPTLVAALDDSSESALEAVGQVLGDTDNNNTLKDSEIDDKLVLIDEAISQYDALEKDSSVKAQLCILYATRVILTIADTIGGDVPLDSSITGYSIDYSSVYTTIRSDIGNIDQYIDDIDDALGTGNSLRDGFDDLINGLGGDPATIDSTDISDYIDAIKGI